MVPLDMIIHSVHNPRTLKCTAAVAAEQKYDRGELAWEAANQPTIRAKRPRAKVKNGGGGERAKAPARKFRIYGKYARATHCYMGRMKWPATCPIVCNWDVVTSCSSVTIFFPLGVWLCSWLFVCVKLAGVGLNICERVGKAENHSERWVSSHSCLTKVL